MLSLGTVLSSLLTVVGFDPGLSDNAAVASLLSSALLRSSLTELSISGASLFSVGLAAAPDRVAVGIIASGVTLSSDGASLILGGWSLRYIVVPSTT